MTEISGYLIKVIMCSGLLFLYYLLAFRNRRLHIWNRFYLLFIFPISTLLPLVRLSFKHHLQDSSGKTGIPFIKAVTSAGRFLDDVNQNNQVSSIAENLLIYIYLLIILFFLSRLILSLLKILKLVRSHQFQFLHGCKVTYTDLPGTPFSFGNYIFWNKEIQLDTETGYKIYIHEHTHVRQKHSMDKIGARFISAFFWINPFFWLIEKELSLIHEFIADENAVGAGQTESLAAMILQAAYPAQSKTLVNYFYQSPVSRRIKMLSHSPNRKKQVVLNFILLPMFLIVAFAFTIKTRYTPAYEHQPSKEITVVIDPGHGYASNGTFSGARYKSINEDDIVLSIAKHIQELNQDPNIHLFLTRSGKESIDLKKRVSSAREHKADLFISLHVNASGDVQYLSDEESKSGGFEVTVPGKHPFYQTESEKIGSIVQQELGGLYTTNEHLISHNTGIWVLDHNVCPSILIECGYINYNKDRNFIIDENNQMAIAGKILQAIARYSNN